MHRIIREIKKKLLHRLWFWIIWAIVGLLIDEHIKEGYWFKVEDVFNNHITHEKIIITLLIILIITLVKRIRSVGRARLLVFP